MLLRCSDVKAELAWQWKSYKLRKNNVQVLCVCVCNAIMESLIVLTEKRRVMMKKFLSMLLVLVLAFALVACGSAPAV